MDIDIDVFVLKVYKKGKEIYSYVSDSLIEVFSIYVEGVLYAGTITRIADKINQTNMFVANVYEVQTNVKGVQLI